MTREEFTELCQMYLEPLSYNNIKTVIMKSNSEQSTAVYCGGTGVTKYDNGYITNKKGVYFPYSFKYYKISGNVIVNKKDGKSPAWMWTDYIKLGLMEDAEIRRRIVKLSEDIRTMMKKIKKDQIKKCGTEYELV